MYASEANKATVSNGSVDIAELRICNCICDKVPIASCGETACPGCTSGPNRLSKFILACKSISFSMFISQFITNMNLNIASMIFAKKPIKAASVGPHLFKFPPFSPTKK
jgi:hypothetical protein